MRIKHEYLTTAPFDLYGLYLYRLVAERGSFTMAAEAAGLTQSAMTRQIQGIEQGLGIKLLERTTRRVRPTVAGKYLLNESVRLTGDVEALLQRLREEFGGARKQVRIGVSKSVSLAYLPGFLHANLRREPSIACQVTHQSSTDIMAALHANELELGIICAPTRLPKALAVTHRFSDQFTLITNGGAPDPGSNSLRSRAFGKWASEWDWLLIAESTTTGRGLRKWLGRHGAKVAPSMEFDSFDLIINLAALGMGASFVPTRALALYGERKNLRRVPLKERFARELVVVTRRRRKLPEHLARFIENILF